MKTKVQFHWLRKEREDMRYYIILIKSGSFKPSFPGDFENRLLDIGANIRRINHTAI